MIQPHPEWCECNECDEDCIDTISEEEYDEMYLETWIERHSPGEEVHDA